MQHTTRIGTPKFFDNTRSPSGSKDCSCSVGADAEEEEEDKEEEDEEGDEMDNGFFFLLGVFGAVD